ncbi:MAG: UDP-N-acetylmuramoyl-L-alanyl-D-glutamate--2,6-diaminopimelate ligase, partial [Clostridia bacterium]|nr:UDP-N-acetylmuramoyl-L-alanyl-D-glutamate--2,6-diaminopimelate ligase [Clostridia bacterium]
VQKILNASGIPTGIIGTVGAEFDGMKIPTANTTPESLELQKIFRAMLDKGCKAVALEVSSLGVKHGRVDGIQFAAGIFTNLSPDHIGPLEHETFEEYAYWKSVMFERCDTAIMNFDDEAYSIMKENCKCKVVSYGLDTDYDISAKNVAPVRNRRTLGISFDCTAFGEDLKITAPVPGTFNAYNILAALGAAEALGADISKAAEALQNIKISGRAEPVSIDADFDVIIDYAHNGLSLKSIIETLYAYKTGRIICVFGSVGGRTYERRKEMGLVAGSMCELSVITSDNPDFEEPENIVKEIAEYVKEAGGKYYAEPDRKKAIEYALSVAEKGDIILLAGKGHETYQLVNGVKEPFSELECINEYMGRIKTDA